MEFTAWSTVKEFEGCRLSAYQDSGGVYTIGWGHTNGVKQGDTCTQAQADQWLASDIQWAVAAVNHYAGIVPQGVFDALVDFTYNVGTRGLLAVIPYVNRKDWQRLCYSLSLYVHDRAGNALAGLVRRRKAEIDLVVGAIPGLVLDDPA